MNKMISKQLSTTMIFCATLFFMLPATDLVPFGNITPAQAATLIRQKGADPHFVILDVRTPGEFAKNRIQRALNIDVKASDFKIKVKQMNRNGIYLVYCRGGVRSANAMKLMKELGCKRVYNLAGGLKNWQKVKLPLEGAPL